MQVLTFGHSTAAAERIARLLRGAEVRRVIDVRIAPTSRHNPDATRDAMSRWLPEIGVAYRWDKRLGGRRKAPADTPDTALRNRSFCGYAGHMRSPEFLAAIDDLLAGAGGEQTTVMCAEAVWWRCHRKLIADFLVLARGVDVRHLMHDGTLRSHLPSHQARLLSERRLLVYDAGRSPLVP